MKWCPPVASVDPLVLAQLGLGLLLLLAGGDGFVRGSVAIARRLGLSPLLIGLTLVGFGTSTPELLTSLQAALAGSPGIAIGNVVGSNTANILLILGLAALIQPLRTRPEAFKRDGTVVLLAALACLGVVMLGEIGRLAGLVLVGALLAYVGYTYVHETRAPDASAAMHEAEAASEPRPHRLWQALLFTVGGLLATLLGAKLLVDGAIELAAAAGISETIVGLTVVAVGTSLPELTVSLVAAFRRQADVAFGNIVGSNIYNVLGILGVTAIVTPIAVPPEIIALDIWVMLGATLLLLGFAITGWRVSRLEGALLLTAYATYLTTLFALTA
jgi:cation:H+ antiporter